MSALRRSEVFATLSLGELKAIGERSRLHAYRAGETIFDRGDPGDALFVVVEGTVRIVNKGEEGEASVIAELVAGDTFGELDLLDQTPRDATAVAASDGIVARFPARGVSFDTAFEGEPAVLAALLFASLRVIAGRIRNANALIKENSPWIQEARRQVYGDKLTGLSNKAFLEERLPGYLKGGVPAALLMIKPDNFKQINDTWGHEAGDAVLRLMATELSRHLREGEVAARYAGNELAAVLPGSDRTAALRRAEEIRAAFGRLDLSPVVGATRVRLSASIGIAVFPEHGATGEALIAAAIGLPLLGRQKGGGAILFAEATR
jgi:diguanylate cyclase (GGDEF)-like protein